MIKNSDIQAAFRSQLVMVPGIPPEDQRAWENKGFAPATGTPWLRETLLHGAETVTANNERQQVGIMQYDLFWPAGEGTYDAKGMADDIKEAFKPSTTLNSLVRIEQSTVRRGGNDGTWYQLIIELSYTVYGTIN